MKLFKKEKFSNGKRNIYFCGMKVFSYRKKTKAFHGEAVYSYLDKYKYVLDNIPEAETSDKYPNAVWQLWFQGEENAPEIVKKCIASVRKYCNETNKLHIILTEENLSDYIDIPDFILEKYHKNIITKTHLSDYVRLALLAKYGGLWIDATVLLTDKIPEDIFSSGFFQFKLVPYISEINHNIFDLNTLKFRSHEFPYTNMFHVGASWFLYADAGNYLINAIKVMFEEYWKHENYLIDYFLFHYIETFFVFNNDIAREIFLASPNYNRRAAFILQSKLSICFDKHTFDTILKITPIHKLTYKYKNDDNCKNSFLNYIENNF